MTRKRCDMEHKLIVLFSNRKSHTGFRSIPKSVTLSDLERPNGRHYALFHAILQLSEPTAASNSLKLNQYCQRKNTGLVTGSLVFLGTTCAISAAAVLFCYVCHKFVPNCTKLLQPLSVWPCVKHSLFVFWTLSVRMCWLLLLVHCELKKTHQNAIWYTVYKTWTTVIKFTA